MVGFLVFGGFLDLGLIIFGLLDTRRWIKSKNTLRLIQLNLTNSMKQRSLKRQLSFS